jgi:hypothetical protein
MENSVAKGPKFRLQNSKGALQKFVRPDWRPNMPKQSRKGAELLEAGLYKKKPYNIFRNYTSSPDIFDFLFPSREK